MTRLIHIVILIFSLLISGCRSSDYSDEIRIIHAGSLSLVVRDVVKMFNKEYPDIKVITESWGSKDGARQITELKKPCDLYISADDRLIEAFLFPEHAKFSIPFAGNEMVIAYTNDSKYSGEITAENWYEFLRRSDVATARSSPDTDPCGVRAVLLMILSGNYYKIPDLKDQLEAKNHNFIRPKEADLIALLQKRSVDYLYIYKSLAVQHNFQFITLPDEVNLSNPDLSDVYKNAAFETVGNRPGSKYREVGSPIVYGLTIPVPSKNPEGAEKFIEILLDPLKGGTVLKKNGQHLLPPQRVRWYDEIPGNLKKYALPK